MPAVRRARSSPCLPAAAHDHRAVGQLADGIGVRRIAGEFTVIRVAVVSGGGTGIGKAITARLVAAGDHVVIVGRRAGELQATAEELSAAGPGKVSWQAADLSRPEEVQRG